MTMICVVGPVTSKWVNDGSDTPMGVELVKLTQVRVFTGRKGQSELQPVGCFDVHLGIDEDMFDRRFWERREGRAVVVAGRFSTAEELAECPELGPFTTQSVIDVDV